MKGQTVFSKWLTLMLLSVTDCSVTYAQALPTVSYSATQIIETVPGPFSNKIYMAANKERQDANLGGAIVSTIIRHDKGVAWLLIPSSKHYQEIDIKTVGLASVHRLLEQGNKIELGYQHLNNTKTKKIAVYTEQETAPSFLWLSEQGILLKAEIPKNLATGRPQATIFLTDVEIGEQDQALFELPKDYTKIKD